MVQTCGEKQSVRCSNENMEDGSEWKPKDRRPILNWRYLYIRLRRCPNYADKRSDSFY